MITERETRLPEDELEQHFAVDKQVMNEYGRKGKEWAIDAEEWVKFEILPEV